MPLNLSRSLRKANHHFRKVEWLRENHQPTFDHGSREKCPPPIDLSIHRIAPCLALVASKGLRERREPIRFAGIPLSPAPLRRRRTTNRPLAKSRLKRALQALSEWCRDEMKNQMRLTCASGSVGGLGGGPPRCTRPRDRRSPRARVPAAWGRAFRRVSGRARWARRSPLRDHYRPEEVAENHPFRFFPDLDREGMLFRRLLIGARFG